MTKERLIKIVERIINVDGTEGEIDDLLKILEGNVPHLQVSDLIYWNEKDLSAEEIVEKALEYKPIKL